MIEVTLKGEKRTFEEGVTLAEIAKSIGMGLFKAACVGKIDNQVADLRTPVTKDCTVEILTFDSKEGKQAYWHTSSHILAQAVKQLFKDAKFGIGPAIDNGFFYDMELPRTLVPEDLEKIEAEMKKIIKADLPLERFTLDENQALDFMKEDGQDFKVELIEEHAGKGEKISFYQQGNFTDLCAGPHLLSTGRVKAIKLTSCTGAYWRADASKQMLQRVYGISFPKTSALNEYLQMLEEAKKRDHRKLGKELSLFTILEEGPGFPFFLPKGMLLKNLLIDYWREIHTQAGYHEIATPIMLSRKLWEQSGHWDHYQENMYTTNIDEQDFAIKPMNCPGGILVYKTGLHSYRDLPLRLGELGQVHRHELSGALHGLMRVRSFTQDDAHIFMTPEQIKDEIKGVVKLIDKVYKTFGFTYHIELSTRPEDAIGSVQDWDYATNALRDAITELGYPVVVNEGDGAFYGPKLDFHLTDCIGRTWQCGTVQLDFQLPERFALEYIGADGEKHRPIMIHRVVFGSIERFIGILIEHYAGAFPVWLSPVQVKVLPISEHLLDYAQETLQALLQAGIRAELDDRNEKIGYKIREAQLEKTPYMLVVGEKERSEQTVSVRKRKEGDIGALPINDFIKRIQQEVANKS